MNEHKEKIAQFSTVCVFLDKTMIIRLISSELLMNLLIHVGQFLWHVA